MAKVTTGNQQPRKKTKDTDQVAVEYLPLPGPPGPRGVRGPRGPQGSDGKTGATGPTGPDGADSTVPGPQGKEGPRGPAGPTGAAGKDSTVAGPAGKEGPKGPAGKDSVVPGPAGKDSTVAGPKGADGKDGERGPSGVAATVRVGSTTTISAGLDAEVTNRGDNHHAILDFRIPGAASGGGDAGPHDHDEDYAAVDHTHPGGDGESYDDTEVRGLIDANASKIVLQETHLDELDVETEALTEAVEGKSDKDHTHEGGGDGETGPHNHNEFTEIQNKQDEQDARLDSIESGDASQIGQYVYNPVPSQDGQVAWDNEKLYFRDRDLGGYAFQAPAPGARFFIRVNDISIVGDISSSTLTDNIAVVTGTWEPALPTPKTGDKVAVNSTEAALDTLHGQVKDLEQTVTDLDDTKASRDELQQVRLDTVGSANVEGAALWMGTQAEYDALPTKRASTLFVVV